MLNACKYLQMKASNVNKKPTPQTWGAGLLRLEICDVDSLVRYDAELCLFCKFSMWRSVILVGFDAEVCDF